MKSTTVVSLTKIAQMLTSRIGRKPLLLALVTTLACLRTATAMKYADSAPLPERPVSNAGPAKTTSGSPHIHALNAEIKTHEAKTWREKIDREIATLESKKREVPIFAEDGPEAEVKRKEVEDHNAEIGKKIEKLQAKKEARDLCERAGKDSKLVMGLIGGATAATVASGFAIGLQLGEAIQTDADIAKAGFLYTGIGLAIVALVLFAFAMFFYSQNGGAIKGNAIGAGITVIASTAGVITCAILCTKLDGFEQAGKWTENADKAGVYAGFMVSALVLAIGIWFVGKMLGYDGKRNAALVISVAGSVSLAFTTGLLLQEGVHDTLGATEMGADTFGIVGFAFGLAVAVYALYYVIMGEHVKCGRDRLGNNFAFGLMATGATGIVYGLSSMSEYATRVNAGETHLLNGGEHTQIESFLTSQYGIPLLIGAGLLVLGLIALLIAKFACNKMGVNIAAGAPAELN